MKKTFEKIARCINNSEFRRKAAMSSVALLLISAMTLCIVSCSSSSEKEKENENSSEILSAVTSAENTSENSEVENNEAENASGDITEISSVSES